MLHCISLKARTCIRTGLGKGGILPFVLCRGSCHCQLVSTTHATNSWAGRGGSVPPSALSMFKASLQVCVPEDRKTSEHLVPALRATWARLPRCCEVMPAPFPSPAFLASAMLILCDPGQVHALPKPQCPHGTFRAVDLSRDWCLHWAQESSSPATGYWPRSLPGNRNSEGGWVLPASVLSQLRECLWSELVKEP